MMAPTRAALMALAPLEVATTIDRKRRQRYTSRTHCTKRLWRGLGWGKERQVPAWQNHSTGEATSRRLPENHTLGARFMYRRRHQDESDRRKRRQPTVQFKR